MLASTSEIANDVSDCAYESAISAATSMTMPAATKDRRDPPRRRSASESHPPRGGTIIVASAAMLASTARTKTWFAGASRNVAAGTAIVISAVS